MSQIQSEFISELAMKIENWLKSPVAQHDPWAKYIKYTPNLLQLLVKLSADKNVVQPNKAKFAVAISYFISPLDMIPERFHGAHGFVDDIALAAYVLVDVKPEYLKTYWEEEADILELTQNIVEDAEKMVGPKIWQRLKDLVEI